MRKLRLHFLFSDSCEWLVILLYVDESGRIDDPDDHFVIGGLTIKKQNYVGQLRLEDTEQFTAEITFFAADGAA